MTYLLLLVNADGAVTTSPLAIRELREVRGSPKLSAHFRPVRSDCLFESAKMAGDLAYSILLGEGIVRGQLWVEYEVLGANVNVTGRSSDLLFALALITSKWKVRGSYPAIAATGVLNTEGTALSDEKPVPVQGVKHAVAKVAAAVEALNFAPAAVIFYPLADAQAVASWRDTVHIPQHIRLRPVGSLEDALAFLGIALEKVHLGNPFRGLEHFEYKHSSIFFGRDAEVLEVAEQLLRREAAGIPGLLVEGASGCGKSSFIRAGVLPALVNPCRLSDSVEQALHSRPVPKSAASMIWRVGLLPSGADESQFVQSLCRSWGSLPEFAGTLNGGARIFDALVREFLDCWPSELRFVWLLDQFEELFGLGLKAQVLEAFGKFLVDLQSHGVWTLASIRADAVPQLKHHHTLRQVFGSNEGQYYLPVINATALDDVIARPAMAAGLSFGTSPSGKRLDLALREDAYRFQENALPLLQFTLYELYLRRSAKTLTFDAYERLGGLSGSVASAAAALLEAEDFKVRCALPRLFRSLVTVDEAGQATRRYASMDEIAQDFPQYRLLLCLVEARLCVTDQVGGAAAAAFAHDALLRTWPVLTDWLQREAGLLQTRELAQRETRLWQQHEESDAWLASTDKLATLKPLIVAQLPLSESVRKFIERSQRRARTTARLKRLAFFAVAVLALAASGAGLVASKKQREAEYQSAETLKAEARLLVATAARRLKEFDVAGAAGIISEVLANPKFGQRHSSAAIGVFQDIRAADRQIAVLSGHSDFVRRAAFSPDGANIVTASDDNTARIWDARTAVQLKVLSGHHGRVNDAAYSPDGRYIVTAGSDKTARVWDARTGAQLKVLSGHDGRVESAAFSPDGSRVVTASWDKTARIWDARTGRQLAALVGHDNLVLSAMFSPDGTQIVTASWDSTARIWDAGTAKQVAVLVNPPEVYFESAGYSPDGSRIVTASDDKTARIWNAHTGALLTVLSGHGDRVYSSAFSPDGTTVVTASLDKTARIWDARAGAELIALSGHQDVVASAAYSPDVTRVVTSSSDKTARIWDAHTGAQLKVLSGHGNFVYCAAFSADGGRVVTASWDKTARVWDATSGVQLGVLAGHEDNLESGGYSPDGARIVTASDDKTARIWDARTFAQLAVLAGHASRVYSAAYSPDGKRIVTASYDKTARIWDAATASQLAELSGHSDVVDFAAYSADGNRIVTASYDKTARLWDAQSGAMQMVLSGHAGYVVSAGFSPNGARVVTASSDGTARLWDAHSGEQLAVLLNLDTVVETVAYSPDGRRIVIASDDKTARILEVPTPPNVASQIAWYAAALTDPLADADRSGLGLPADSGKRIASATGSACDAAAAAFYDPDRLARGTAQTEINIDVGNSACVSQAKSPGYSARVAYQLGRVSLARHDVGGARRQFEVAVSKGYRAARIDLADMLVDPSARLLDGKRALSLYESAWHDGIPIAAFKLGAVYENGMPGADQDIARAWSWYRRGADASEPYSLARFAERDESEALMQTDLTQRDALLIDAFRSFAAAVERADAQDWPDDIGRHWRHRRATLARLLARDGMMQQVSDAYNLILRR